MEAGMVVGSLDMVELGKSTTIGTLSVRISGMRRFAIRRVVGMALIRMGVAILPVGLDVSTS